jgi:hypothetical protein
VALVLAIEPDTRQGGILRRIVGELVGAELVLVESREAAIAAIADRVPDVLLVTALLSPRDEDELVAHLRGLDGAEHLQTHTIPLLSGTRATDASPSKSSGLFGKFLRRKEVELPIAGCDPEIFAEEVRTFLKRAAQLKAEAVTAIARAAEELEEDLADSHERRRFAAERPAAASEQASASAAGADSTWSDPFAWKSSYGERPAVRESEPAPSAAEDLRDLFLRQHGDGSQPAADSPLDEEQQAEAHRLEAEHLRAEADAAAARARHEERARLEAEAATAAAVEHAREEERERLEAARSRRTARPDSSTRWRRSSRSRSGARSRSARIRSGPSASGSSRSSGSEPRRL